MPSALQDRILHNATELFASRGYRGTSMREVAEAVGCTKPALYYHFKNKQDLFVAAITRELDLYNQMIQEVIAHPGSMRSRLKLGIDRFIHLTQQRPAAMQLLMHVQHRPEFEDAPQLDFLSMHQANKELIEILLTDGIQSGEVCASVDVASVTVSLIGLVNIWGTQCLLGLPLPEDVSDHILDIFFHGVTPS